MPIPRAIEAVVDAFRRAQLAGDAAAAAALFSDDAVMYPPVSEAVVQGRPAIEQLLHAVHRQLRIVHVEYGERRGDVGSDMAYVHWRYVLRVQLLSGGVEPTTVRGRLLWVLRRWEGDEGGDAWRVAAHHASVEPAPPKISARPLDAP